LRRGKKRNNNEKKKRRGSGGESDPPQLRGTGSFCKLKEKQEKILT
jgi:hypothetical protein